MDGGLPPPAPPLERSDVVMRGYLLSGKARRLSPGVITQILQSNVSYNTCAESVRALPAS